MGPDSFSRRGRAPVVALCAVVLGAWLVPGTAAVAPSRAPAPTAMPAGTAASAPHVSPHVLAAQRRAREAAAEPIKVNPLTMHRPHMPRATGR